MSPIRFHAERKVSIPAADLCALVGDVCSYPRFVPWITDVAVFGIEQLSEGWRGNALVRVGWSGLSQRLITRVTYLPDQGRVDISLVRGPLKRLEAQWRFESRPGGAYVTFNVEYAFANPVVHQLAYLNRGAVTSQIISAFEDEAHRRQRSRLEKSPASGTRC